MPPPSDDRRAGAPATAGGRDPERSAQRERTVSAATRRVPRLAVAAIVVSAAIVAAAIVVVDDIAGGAADRGGAEAGARFVADKPVAYGRPCADYKARWVARLWRTPCWRPYARSSPFNRPLPPDARLAPRSADVVARMTGWGPPQDLLVGHADTSSDYFHPLYWSHRNDPVFRVRCVRYRPCDIENKRVRIPSRARPAGGGDGHLAVIDQRSGWEYDFWQVRSKPAGGGTLIVSHGGRTRIDGSGLGSNATAGSFGLAAGVIRAAEVRAGRIDHALFAQVRCTSGRSVYPAESRSTGAPCETFGTSNESAPPLGARFKLDLTADDIARLEVPSWKKTILTALARYGMIVGDTAGGNGAWGLQVESGSSYTSFGRRDPWRSLAQELRAGRYGRGYYLELDGGVEWARHLRQVAPCVSQGTC